MKEENIERKYTTKRKYVIKMKTSCIKQHMDLKFKFISYLGRKWEYYSVEELKKVKVKKVRVKKVRVKKVRVKEVRAKESLVTSSYLGTYSPGSPLKAWWAGHTADSRSPGRD